MIKVPKERWIECILTGLRDERLKFIKIKEDNVKEVDEKNRSAEKLNDQKFEIEMQKYLDKENKAKLVWVLKEEEKQKNINYHNENLTKINNAINEGEISAIAMFVKLLITRTKFSTYGIKDIKVGFNTNTKKMILNVYIHNKDDIFKYCEYRYIKKDQKFIPKEMKVSDKNKYLKIYQENLCKAIIYYIYNSSIGDLINNLVVNIYHGTVCCVSSQIEKNQFIEYDLSVTSEVITFDTRHMRVYKTLNTGVKCYDNLFDL